ncbi:MAG: DNA replication complex GINS family protein [Nitrososphaerota archaeon]|jgi:DNA replication factor GINS|nr:DNA replication complex GINS family protein [Nitrososphaerota archaeon]MDG6929708.1 DNA replication complex GINS family protein [Nitrososphaerota archaeon]MDG6932677.1 DNA replication complex GINS family protein [Nitrososphaerota archaeon]MDG6936135.1 DNA replication complex GINS family protein [Nitrososphaerota archaeon]MDG6944316.1 DNA replication complex GINS family protein [Nitrososphaerota archaeon]
MLKTYEKLSSLKLISKTEELYKIKVQVTSDIDGFIFREFGINEPKQGDIIDVESWLGTLMVKAGHARIMSEEFENEVLNSLNREKLIGQYQLSSIKPDFYVKFKALLSYKEKTEADKIRMYAMDLVTLRMNKIVQLALQGVQYEKLSSTLTPEESIFFQEIRETVEYWKLRMLSEI